MRKWLPLVAIGLGSFMLLIDITIVNVALPAMLRDLRASFGQMQWVIDIYPLALATLLLGVGSTADVLGLKRVYVAGLVVFALSSLAAGLSTGALMLIGARAAQGVGAAAMFATTIALINSCYSGRDRGVAFGVWGAINGAAAAIGPVLGGALTQGLSWRWVFFVNLPLSVLAVAISLRVLADERLERGSPIDGLGVATFMLAAGAGAFALTRAAEVGWRSTTLGAAALAAVGALAFIAVERRRDRPILDLRLLARPSFSGVLAGALLLSVSAFGYLAFLSVWLQSIRGLSPIGVGLAYLPLSVVSLVVSLLTGHALAARSARSMISIGLALMGIGALMQAHLHAGSSWLAIEPGQVVDGVGVGLAIPVLASAALAAAPPARSGMAAGAVTTGRQLGYALGIAALGLLCQTRLTDTFAARTGHRLSTGAAQAVTAGRVDVVLSATPVAHRAAAELAVRSSYASAVNATMIAAGIAGLLGAVIVVAALRPSTE